MSPHTSLRRTNHEQEYLLENQKHDRDAVIQTSTSLTICNKQNSCICFNAISSLDQIRHPVPYILRKMLLSLTLNQTVTRTVLESIYTT